MKCPCGHQWDDHIALRDRSKGWCIVGGCHCREVGPDPNETHTPTLFDDPEEDR